MYYQEKNHPSPGKNLYVEKITSKWPKIDFLDMEFWLLSESSFFRPRILETTITKYALPETTLETACNDVPILFLGRIRENVIILETS